MPALRLSFLTFGKEISYFNDPDPWKCHQVVRDFVVTVAGFIVSVIEILQLLGIKS